jgi:surface protein
MNNQLIPYSILLIILTMSMMNFNSGYLSEKSLLRVNDSEKLTTFQNIHLNENLNEEQLNNTLDQSLESRSYTQQYNINNRNLDSFPIYDKKAERNILQNVSKDSFVTVWDTRLTNGTSTNNHQIKLPLEVTGSYNFIVDWGDKSSDLITSWDQKETTHYYSMPGIYIITIAGLLNGWSFNNRYDMTKITEIMQWGNISVGNSGGYFFGAQNLQLTAQDYPNLTETTNLKQAFAYAISLGNSERLDNWNVTGVTNMYKMFYGSVSFNQSISNWDVSSVTNMEGMFAFTGSFNQPIGNWDVSSVTNMKGMFFMAESFNQPLGDWNISNVIDMNYMFTNIALSVINYNHLLIGWAALPLKEFVTFDVGDSKYGNEACKARQHIIINYGWIITDAGNINLITCFDELKNKTLRFLSENFLGVSIIIIMLSFKIIVMFNRHRKEELKQLIKSKQDLYPKR